MSCHVSHYHGLASVRNRRKYEGYARSKVRGITVRLLSAAEIKEFQSYIDRVIAGMVNRRRQWCALI